MKINMSRVGELLYLPVAVAEFARFCLINIVAQIVSGDVAALGEGVEQARDDGLLDLRPREPLRGQDQVGAQGVVECETGVVSFSR